MRIPVCIICGNDKVHTPAAARKAAALIPGSEFHDDVVAKRPDNDLLERVGPEGLERQGGPAGRNFQRLLKDGSAPDRPAWIERGSESTCEAFATVRRKKKKHKGDGHVARIASALAALSMGAAVLTGPASAQDNFPNRTITIVVAFAAGGTSDIIARLLGQEDVANIPARRSSSRTSRARPA